MELLGRYARDVATGLTGYLVSYSEHFNGVKMYDIQPFNTAGDKILEGQAVDIPYIQILEDEAHPPLTVLPPIPQDIALGDKVKDKLTPFTGTVVTVAIFLNGCTFVKIIGDKLNDKGQRTSEFTSAESLEKLNKTPIAPVKSKTGGPSQPPMKRGA